MIKSNFEWAIYKQYESETNSRKLSCNKEDNASESIAYIINDIYFLLGLQNIDKENDGNRQKYLTDRLSELDEEHTFLIVLKQIIYNELYEFEQNGKRDEVESTYEINVFIEEWFKDRHIRPHLFELRENYFREVFSSRMQRELSHILIDYLYYYKEHNESKIIKQKFKIYYALKKIPLDSRGNSLRFFFFLDIIMESLFKESYQEVDDENINNLDNILNEYIREINKITFKRQMKLQEDMLLCYMQNPVSSRSLYFHMKDIVDALISCEKAYKYYFSKLSNGCVATMNFNNTNYFTLSGGSKGDEIIDLITSGKYKKVKCSDDVRYYYDKNLFITLKKQKESFDKYKLYYTNSEINLVMRMFSCCERKLLTMLYGNGGHGEAKIYVKFKPCFMCERAIDDFINNSRVKCSVCYPEKKHVKRYNKNKIKNFDVLGEKINAN